MIAVPTGMNDGTSETHADAFRTIRNKDAREISALMKKSVDKPHLAQQFPDKPQLAYFELDINESPSPSAYLNDAKTAKEAGFQMDAKQMSEKTGYTLTLAPSSPAVAPGMAFNRNTGHAHVCINASASKISSQPWLDKLAESSINPISKARAQLFSGLLAKLKGGTAQDVPGVLYSWTPDEADAQSFASVVASLAFNAALRGQIPPKAKPGIVKNSASDPLSGVFGLPFEDAMKFWEAKGLSQDLINATWAQGQAYGFKVAGITNRNALNNLKGRIGDILNGTSTIDDFVKQATDEYGLNPVHAEIVARTNVQTAYAWGNYQMLQATKEDFPFWGFDVVVDGHTSNI